MSSNVKTNQSPERDSGQGLVEYLILVSLVAVASILILKSLSRNLKEQYANVSAAIRGAAPVSTTAPQSDAYREHGMNDFYRGSSSEGGGP